MNNNDNKEINKQEVNNGEDKAGKQQIRGILYREEDINMLLKKLTQSKADFDNFDLFYLLKKVLLNPIRFGDEDKNEQ